MSKVLVIDDEPFILMMVEDKLKRAGLKVITLRESIKALEVVRKEKPDLIIVDWMMPEMSGIELSRQLKSDPKCSMIPIFMLTAKGQEEDEKLGFRSGITRYIIKPFSPKMLLQMVLEELGETESPDVA